MYMVGTYMYGFKWHDHKLDPCDMYINTSLKFAPKNVLPKLL